MSDRSKIGESSKHSPEKLRYDKMVDGLYVDSNGVKFSKGNKGRNRGNSRKSAKSCNELSYIVNGENPGNKPNQ